ncbi:hypothetical protein HDU67_007089, partial [Dinochytrium kinnereticum]
METRPETDVFTAQYVRRLASDSKRAGLMLHSLQRGNPYVEIAFAVVAMVDVSGYSLFTSRVSVMGKIGSEVITEEVGNYIKKVGGISIATLGHNGDVVKFLGDAILVTFSAQDGETQSDVSVRGITCCLDIMINCASFRAKGTAAFRKRLLATDEASSRWSSSFKHGTRVDEEEVYKSGQTSQLQLLDFQELKLHTAVTAGDIHQIIIGDTEDRLDYFIYGQCLDPLFESLAGAKADDCFGGVLLTSSSFWLLYKTFLSLYRTKPQATNVKLPPLKNHESVLEVIIGIGFKHFVNSSVVRRMRLDSKWEKLTECQSHTMQSLESEHETGRSSTKFLEKIDVETGNSINISITTGEVLFSEIGWSKRKEASVLGDVVNMAARLACLPSVKSGIFCDERTWETIRNPAFHYMGSIYVKGKEEPINVWEMPIVEIKLSGLLTSKTQYVGYVEERNTILNRLHAWHANQKKTCILVEAESGMGKSKLMQWLIDRLDSSESFYCLLQGSEIEGWTPYNGVSNILSFFLKNAHHLYRADAEKTNQRRSYTSLTRKVNEPDDSAMEIASLLPQLRQEKRGATFNKERVACILQSIIERFIECCKVIIIVDDAQWIDPVSIEIFELIMQASDKIFSVYFSRPIDKAANQVSRLFSNALKLQLQGISKSDLEHFILSKFSNSRIRSVDAMILDEVLDPFGRLSIDLELLRTILEPGISSIVIMQFDRFQEILKVASVLGQYFDVTDAMLLLPKSIQMTLDDWIQLISENDIYQFLVKDGNSISRTDLYFRHIFIAEAIYESISYSERESLHARAAEHFESFLTESNRAFLLPVVSFHYSRSSMTSKNIECLEELGCLYLESRKKMIELIEAFNNFGSSHAIEGSSFTLESIKIQKTRAAYWYAVLGNAEARLREYEEARKHTFLSLEMIDDPWPFEKRQIKKEIIRGIGRHIFLFLKTRGGKKTLRNSRRSIDNEKEKVRERALASLQLSASTDSNFTIQMRALLLIKSLNVAIRRATENPYRWAATCIQTGYDLAWSIPKMSHLYLKLGQEAAKLAGPQIYEYYFYTASMHIIKGKFREAEEACEMRLRHATFHNYAMGKLACHLFDSELQFFRGNFAVGIELLKAELNNIFATDMVLGYASLTFLLGFLVLFKEGDIKEAVNLFSQFTENIESLNMLSMIGFSTVAYAPFLAWLLIFAIQFKSRKFDMYLGESRILEKALNRITCISKSIVHQKGVIVLDIPHRFLHSAHLYASGRAGNALIPLEPMIKMKEPFQSLLNGNLAAFQPLVPLCVGLSTFGDADSSNLRESIEKFKALNAQNFDQYIRRILGNTERAERMLSVLEKGTPFVETSIAVV